MSNSNEQNQWLRVIQAEYRELPGLKLTMPQAQRLWGLDGEVCEALFETLIASRFLCKTSAQSFILVEQR